MDATGNGAYLAEVAAQKYGVLRIEQVKLNAGWYLEHFPPLKAAFEDGNILIPADDDQLGDLALVKMVRGTPVIPEVRTTAADGKKRHGDFAVALVLAYAHTRSNTVEFGYRGPSTEMGDPMGGPDEGDGETRSWWKPPLGAGMRGSV
jgi:phage FluMu gp28-like protein